MCVQVECGDPDELYLKTPLDNGSGSDDSSDDEREVGGGGGANSSDEEIGDMIIILNKVSPVQLLLDAWNVNLFFLVTLKMKVCSDMDEGFSLRDALQEGYFSDLVITSSDGQPFNVHRTVLASCCPNMTYREWEMVLRTMKPQHLSAVLQ